MPRQPKLRKKAVGKERYWYTEAGRPTYFGNVDDVPYSQAQKLFADHIQSLRDERNDAKLNGFTAGDLLELFLDWVRKHRSHSTWTTRRIYGERFVNFKVGNGRIGRIGRLPASKVTASDLEAFLESMNKDGYDPQTLLHAETSIRHCWNWGAKHPSPTPYLPASFRPFAAVERTHVPRKALTEADLITHTEIDNLFTCGEVDLDQFRRYGLEETIRRQGVAKLKRSGDFTEMLKCYHHTGARTDELASCEVGDFLPRTSQIILGKHKRSRTQRHPTIRHITLNAEALAIIKKHCEAKQSSDKLCVAHVILRAGRRCQPVYEAIRRSVRRSAWVVPDETGWRVGGLLAWLHGFVARRSVTAVFAKLNSVFFSKLERSARRSSVNFFPRYSAIVSLLRNPIGPAPAGALGH